MKGDDSVKVLLVSVLILACAASAAADVYGRIRTTNAVATDKYGRAITNTYYQNKGDVEVAAIYGTNVSTTSEPTLGVGADTVDVAIGSGGMPSGIILTKPEEATLEMGWIRFKESVDGITHSYTWGDWCPFYIGAAKYEDYFKCGLWDSCQIILAGSAFGKVDVYHRWEMISDD